MVKEPKKPRPKGLEVIAKSSQLVRDYDTNKNPIQSETQSSHVSLSLIDVLRSILQSY
jgi:hypothetical protein